MKKEIIISLNTNESNELLIGELDNLLAKIYKLNKIQIGDSNMEYIR